MRILLEQRLLCREGRRTGGVPGENLRQAVAQGDGFCYSDQAAKNLDLAALWERVGVARNVAVVV